MQEFDSASWLSKRPGSVWKYLWGHALKRFLGINRKSRVLYPGPWLLWSAIWSSIPIKHYNGWLVVFNVPSTARSFKDGTPFTVSCEGREARFLHRSHRESNPGPLRGSPLHNRCATHNSLIKLKYWNKGICWGCIILVKSISASNSYKDFQHYEKWKVVKHSNDKSYHKFRERLELSVSAMPPVAGEYILQWQLAGISWKLCFSALFIIDCKSEIYQKLSVYVVVILELRFMHRHKYTETLKDVLE